MAMNPAAIPFLSYADGAAALDWLVRAFGFTETTRWLDDEGRLAHGEVDAFGAPIQLTQGADGYEGPKEHRRHCERAARWQAVPYVVDGVMVHVPDVDAHLATARREGAEILSEPEDEPYGRLYRAEDVEGHRWMFLQPPAGETPTT